MAKRFKTADYIKIPISTWKLFIEEYPDIAGRFRHHGKVEKDGVVLLLKNMDSVLALIPDKWLKRFLNEDLFPKDKYYRRLY